MNTLKKKRQNILFKLSYYRTKTYIDMHYLRSGDASRETQPSFDFSNPSSPRVYPTILSLKWTVVNHTFKIWLFLLVSASSKKECLPSEIYDSVLKTPKYQLVILIKYWR